MKTKNDCKKTSIFPSNSEDIIAKIQKIRTFQKVTNPIFSFETLDDEEDLETWQVNKFFHFKLRLFTEISLGTLRVKIVKNNSCLMMNGYL